MDIAKNQSSLSNSDRPTYWLTKFMILRLLGIIYAVAFLVAINEILPLIGSDGLTPVGIFLDHEVWEMAFRSSADNFPAPGISLSITYFGITIVF